MNPQVSIIIATYRRKDELKRAVLSVANQTYDNIEIIVVDDNDDIEWNDIVTDIINESSHQTGKNIKLIQNHPNQGSAKTRNVGISNANGEYVAFLDDDDIYLPDRILSQVKEMKSNCADYGITDLTLYNENNTINEKRKRQYLLTKEANNLLVCHLKYHLTGTDTLMFRKDYLETIGGFDPIDSGDEYYLMMKAVRSGGYLCYLPRCDVKAYVHTGECGLSSGEGKIKGEEKLFEYKKEFFSELSKKDQSYIKMRHYAVLAFAYLRMRKPASFLMNGIKGFFASPIDCLKIIVGRKML